MADDFEVLSGAATDPAAVLEVLNDAYEAERFGQDWLDWKHRSGPWGVSLPILARADDGVLGAVFALPWDFEINGAPVHGVRFVDGGTTPAARRRGVFKRMIGHELDRWAREGANGLLLATATPAAQASHVKNGAVALAPIRYAYGPPPRPRVAKLTVGDGILDSFVSNGRGIGTAWTPDALRWRTDRRSGHAYEAAALATADEPNGIVYRVIVGRVRTLVPTTTWGPPRTRRALVGAVARSERCVAMLAPTGEGAAPTPSMGLVKRGQVLVCVWDRLSSRPGPDPAVLASWQLTAADVEGLI